MIEPAIPQEPEGIRTRAIWWVGIVVIMIGAVLVGIAWWLVVPPTPVEGTVQASPLEHGLIERASGGADLRAAGELELERAAWVDHKTGVVRIPIEAAIDAVVADPRLIEVRQAAVSGANADIVPPASATPAAGATSPAMSAATTTPAAPDAHEAVR